MTLTGPVANSVLVKRIVPGGLFFLELHPPLHLIYYTGTPRRIKKGFAETKVNAVTGMTDGFAFNRLEDPDV